MLKSRKRIRLDSYDYSDNGVYFITICTKDKKKLFWNKSSPCGSEIVYPDCLSYYGKIVYSAIENIHCIYSYAQVNVFTVMPNHIHLLLSITNDVMENSGRMISAPTKNISTIIGQLKRSVSKEIGKPIWQKSFYDHIVRDDYDLSTKWEYILNNPLKWIEDEYF